MKTKTSWEIRKERKYLSVGLKMQHWESVLNYWRDQFETLPLKLTVMFPEKYTAIREFTELSLLRAEQNLERYKTEFNQLAK